MLSEICFQNSKKRFPRANISRFQVQVDFDTNRKATAAVLFPESDGSLSDPLIQDGKYWSQAMKDALGFHQDGGFPPQLSPFIQTKIKKPTSAVDFSEETAKHWRCPEQRTKDLCHTDRILYYQAQRNLQEDTDQIHNLIIRNYWLGGPFWPQQLNFALWCATTGCGISRDILFPSGSILNLSPQVRSFYLFHVYFTVRRILYEIGGIESVDALPDDPTFKQKTNKYEIASYKKTESAVSSVSTPALTFASHMGKTTGLATCTLESHMRGPGLQITTIQTLT